METHQFINELESRQLSLRAIMASSDERAAKCFKNGTSFRETYPEDFARYEAANAEYNRNERMLEELAERAERERRAAVQCGTGIDPNRIAGADGRPDDATMACGTDTPEAGSSKTECGHV